MGEVIIFPQDFCYVITFVLFLHPLLFLTKIVGKH